MSLQQEHTGPDEERDELTEIGRLDTEQAVEKLRAIGDDDSADALLRYAREHEEVTKVQIGDEKKETFSLRERLFGMPSWRAATHVIGYMPSQVDDRDSVEIVAAERIDPAKRRRQLNATVRLLRLGIFDYPGGRGQHDILVDFGVRNARAPGKEKVHFSQAYSVTQPGYAVNGFPVFKDVKIDDDGLSMSCRMVNVRNGSDKLFLDVLSSRTFQQGLDLAGAFQPALKPLTELARGLTTAFAKRNENALVQKVEFQLAFDALRFAPRLRAGTYIFVQVPDIDTGLFDWADWRYYPQVNSICRGNDKTSPLHYNHFVLGIVF